MLGADEIRQLGDASYVLDGRTQVRWESTAALAADVAAAAELRTRLEGWDALAVDERRDLLTGLRVLRDRCPACDSGVTTTAERLEHCCRRPRVGIRSACEACDRPLVEVVVTESSADPWLELAGVTVADDSASTQRPSRVIRPSQSSPAAGSAVSPRGSISTSISAAAALYSGIFERSSSTWFVSLFAEAAAKCGVVQTTPLWCLLSRGPRA